GRRRRPGRGQAAGAAWGLGPASQWWWWRSCGTSQGSIGGARGVLAGQGEEHVVEARLAEVDPGRGQLLGVEPAEGLEQEPGTVVAGRQYRLLVRRRAL